MEKSTVNIDINAKFNNLMGKVGDITVASILSDSSDGKKILNLKLLTQSLASNILALSRVNIKVGSDDETKINTFLNYLAIATEKFCNFLDYDGNGVVELVARNEKGEIIAGNDINAMLIDGQQVTSSFKNINNIQTFIIAVISTMVMYFTNKNIVSTRADFVEFKLACGNSFTAMMNLKTLNHDDFFRQNIDDFMRFIITMCVLIVPIIDLAHSRIAAINDPANKNNLISLAVISKDDIKKVVTNMYGVDMEFILSSVDSLVTAFIDITKIDDAKTNVRSVMKKI